MESYAPIKALAPIPLLVALLPVVWWFFRDTWKSLDEEANQARALRLATGQIDYRPAACMLITAVVLTVQEYYGGRAFYERVIRPELVGLSPPDGPESLALSRFDELYGFAWWSLARVFGYVLVPLPIFMLLFPSDRVLDMGLRIRGFFSHLWIYLVCLATVCLVVVVIASQPEFGTYYPFYKGSSRSWADFFAWEALYFLQFFALEFFFRGWMLAALRRSLGASAIFVMAVPYCMIHYGKPYLEAHGAIIAGLVLGSLAMRTRSIYAGFLVHIAVAFLMDFLALLRRDALPTQLWPGP
jgi:membrane protease YdiL (CAAX protease family)